MCRQRGAHERGDAVGLLRRAKRGLGYERPETGLLWARALSAVLSGDLASADFTLTSLVEQGEQRPEVYNLLGRVVRERGDLKRALQIHQALVLRRDLSGSLRVEALSWKPVCGSLPRIDMNISLG